MDMLAAHACDAKRDEHSVVKHDAGKAAFIVDGLLKRQYDMTDDSTSGHNYRPGYDPDSKKTEKTESIIEQQKCFSSYYLHAGL